MISRVLTKSGIKVGNEQSAKNSEKKKLEPKKSEDIKEYFTDKSETEANKDDKPTKNQKEASDKSTKICVKAAIDLESIKRRTKHLRADVDNLLEILQMK